MQPELLESAVWNLTLMLDAEKMQVSSSCEGCLSLIADDGAVVSAAVVYAVGRSAGLAGQLCVAWAWRLLPYEDDVKVVRLERKVSAVIPDKDSRGLVEGETVLGRTWPCLGSRVGEMGLMLVNLTVADGILAENDSGSWYALSPFLHSAFLIRAKYVNKSYTRHRV